MYRKTLVLLMVLAMAMLAVTFSVYADGPNFGAAIYADGMAYGTKGLGDLPAPNGHNQQSFDKLYAITNGVDGQLAVAEAAPGRGYNGGRWWLQLVTWKVDPYLLTSEYDILAAEALGHLTIMPTESYFECPLLPVKQ